MKISAGLAVVMLLAAGHFTQAPAISAETMRTIAVESEPLRGFLKEDPDRRTFGRLEWRGGVILNADDSDFGGWSGLIAYDGGKRLLAVTDRQHWMKAELAYDGNVISGLRDVNLGPFAPEDKEMLGIGHDRDAEAVALVSGTPDDGELLVSFERKTRLALLPIKDKQFGAVIRYLDPPPEAKEFGENKGFEGATIIAGGPLKGTPIAIAERYHDASGNHLGWIWIDGKPQQFSLKAVPDFDISDIASLPDGSLIILERRASLLGGFAMRLRHVTAESIASGTVLDGEVLLEADSSYEIDNMEALSVSENDAGETILTLMSDNNFSYFLQRNIILQFVLQRAS